MLLEIILKILSKISSLLSHSLYRQYWLGLCLIPALALAADPEPTQTPDSALGSEALGSESETVTESSESTGEEDLSEASEKTVGTNDNTEGEQTKQTVSIPERHLPNISTKRAQSLLHHMQLINRADEVVTITSPTEDFYGLYLPHAAASPQGGILILHDQQQHGHWPEVIGPLRDYLPQFGWSTLTIELPERPLRQRSPREKVLNTSSESIPNSDETNNEDSDVVSTSGDETLVENNSENEISEEEKDSSGTETDDTANIESEDASEPALPRLKELSDIKQDIPEQEESNAPVVDEVSEFQETNRERVRNAIGYLHSKNQYNLVIIGYGRGAAWAIDYIHQQILKDEDPVGLTLITIDALPNYYDPSLMNQQLTDITIPYLDLLQPTEFRRAQDAQKRSNIMKRNNNSRYRQITTQAISGYNKAENPTSRRIRGWIMRNASGTQVKIKP